MTGHPLNLGDNERILPTKIKAYAYLRVSGKGQIHGDGFPRQLAAIETYAKTNGISIAHVYQEEGVNGSRETMDRPAWIDLMVALHSNGVRTVIVEKLDRLARDLMVQEAAIGDFQRHGFTLISVAEPDLMATDATRVLIRQIMGAVAQYEKCQIVARLRGARMRMKAETGRCEGTKPFGSYEGEDAIIGRMKELRASGLGFDRMAIQMNDEAIPTRTGKPWHGIVINRILKAQTK